VTTTYQQEAEVLQQPQNLNKRLKCLCEISKKPSAFKVSAEHKFKRLNPRKAAEVVRTKV
jgi:hypothetical protein